mgnify:FL=1
MYRSLELVRSFRKDINNLRFSNEHYVKYIVYLSKLLSKEPLPPEALDHALKGEWQDFREFHISGDLLVIYRIDGDIIRLTRIGTHSELFG